MRADRRHRQRENIRVCEVAVESGFTQKQLSDLIDSLPEGVFAVDRNKRIVFFNRSAESIIGINRREAVGRPCVDVLRADRCGSACPLERMITTGERTFEQTVRIVTAEGRKKTLSIATALLTDARGEITGAIETFRDLSHDIARQAGTVDVQSFQDIVSINAAMQKVFGRLPTIADSSSTVLLEGETGTGKELFARAIHSLSPRCEGPFVVVNCGALPDNLLEAELFGHKAGAFTDAKTDRPGRFARAEGGTIVLDEVGEMSGAMQVKLLRVLQEKTYEPVGSDETVRADVRVIAATNKDLLRATEEGAFRKDLYYRLNVIRIPIPPLRDRRDDIPLLADFFVRSLNRKQHKRIRGFSDEAVSVLMAYEWPGNVRELENAVEYAFVLCPKGYIELQHLPESIQSVSASGPGAGGGAVSLKSVETAFVLNALKRNKWNYRKTAQELGIHRTSLYRKLKSLGIAKPGRRRDSPSGEDD